MDELNDLTVNAGTELSRGRVHDALSKVLRVLVVLVQEHGRMAERVKLLERRIEKLEQHDPW